MGKSRFSDKQIIAILGEPEAGRPSAGTKPPIEAGLPTEAFVADVLISKYADHLPLYRQAQMLAREGVRVDRSTLAHWVGFAAFGLSASPRAAHCDPGSLPEALC